MNVSSLLSIIICFQANLCTYPNFSELCKHGSANEVIAALQETAALPDQAQLCFDEAVSSNNIEAVEAIPNKFPISPNRILERAADDHKMATILLKSNWSMNGQVFSGQELFTSHLTDGTFKLPENLRSILISGINLGYLGVVKALVEEGHVNGAIVSETGLLNAIASEHYDIVHYILKWNARNEDWLVNWLLQACKFSSLANLKLVKMICEEFNVDPNVKDGQALFEAVRSGNIDLLKYLISRGLDLDKGFNEAFLHVSEGDTEMAKFLLSCPEADSAADYNEILMIVSIRNKKSILEVLLRDPRVHHTLDSETVEFILVRRCSGNAKLILLKWITKNLTEVNMGWIPVYKFFMLNHPKLAGNFQNVKNNAVSKLRAEGLRHIANFIEAWAVALEKCAIRVSSQPIDKVFDLTDMFLSEALSS